MQQQVNLTVNSSTQGHSLFHCDLSVTRTTVWPNYHMNYCISQRQKSLSSTVSSVWPPVQIWLNEISMLPFNSSIRHSWQVSLPVGSIMIFQMIQGLIFFISSLKCYVAVSGKIALEQKSYTYLTKKYGNYP